ncbi:MFS sugar transporter, partial [Pseudoalteromonas carrageenovora]
FNIGIAPGSMIGGSIVESMNLQDTAWIGASISALALIATRYSGMLDTREVQQA